MIIITDRLYSIHKHTLLVPSFNVFLVLIPDSDPGQVSDPLLQVMKDYLLLESKMTATGLSDHCTGAYQVS